MLARTETNKVHDYALMYAKGKDWVHHVESNGGDSAHAEIIVTCPMDEIPEEIPDVFSVAPLYPEIWEKQKPFDPNAAPIVPRVARVATGEGSAPSEPRRPGAVKTVWDTCNSMPDAARKEKIAACIALGINPSTASVQIGAWSKARSNSS